MKVNLPHCIRQLPRGPHRVVLEQFEQHLRGVIRGEHSLQELADLYCLNEEPAAQSPANAA
jgi:hypothetical protein